MYRKPIYLIIAIVILGVGAKLYSYHQNEINKAKQSVVQEYDTAYVRGLEDQLAVSKALMEDAVVANGRLEDEKRNISSQHAALLDSVRKRPSREESYSASNSSGSCSPPAITGQELSREDAEFLTGEAASAMTILKERDRYYEAYVKLKSELDKLNGKNSSP